MIMYSLMVVQIFVTAAHWYKTKDISADRDYSVLKVA